MSRSDTTGPTPRTDDRASASRRRYLAALGTGLTAGVAGCSSLSIGVRAGPPERASSSEIVPVHNFVRAADDAGDAGNPFEEPTSEIPKREDLLVDRLQGLPVDDGTDPETVDGEIGQLTWGQFSDIDGRIELKCLEKGTHVSMHLSGLVPRALYTAWVVAFDAPGFVDDRNLATATRHIVGWAPLGTNDGSENVFRPSKSGEAQLTAIDESDTWPNGPAAQTSCNSETCLLEEFEVHFIGGYHLDDKTNGSQFRPNGIEQFAFVAKNGNLL